MLSGAKTPLQCASPVKKADTGSNAFELHSPLHFLSFFISPSHAQVNLGDAVLRGLFSRWMEQHLRSHSNRNGSCRQRGGNGSANGRNADNGSAYSSGESDSDDDSEQGEGWEEESSLTSPVSGESSQASARDGGARQTGSGSVRGSNALDVDVAGGGGDSWEGAARGGRTRAIREDTVVVVTEGELGGNGGMQRTLLQKRVGEFDGTEVRPRGKWSAATKVEYNVTGVEDSAPLPSSPVETHISKITEEGDVHGEARAVNRTAVQRKGRHATSSL